jgi:thioredoxin-like negative regulator of GroEL
MHRSDLQFQKALHLLDRGDLARGETILRETLSAAEQEGDRSLVASIRCCLGELLIETDRSAEAAMVIRPVAALDEYDDLVAHERRQAIELLRRTGEV